LAGGSKLRQEEERPARAPRAARGEGGGEAGGEAGDGAAAYIRFEYPESAGAPFVPAWDGWEYAEAASFAAIAGSAPASSGREAEAAANLPGAEAGSQEPGPDMARLLGEERERGFEAGFEAGRRQGMEETREAARAAGEQAERWRIAQLAAALESFAGERNRYLEAVEGEVVKLALAVAARVLRREATVDPLLVSGAVRAALGQIAASTEVRLRVPAAELDLWREALAAVPNLAARPTVVAGEGMQLGECVLETALGTADLGIDAQLAEVRRVLLEEPAAVSTTASRASGQEKTFCEGAV
jgi:flagellar assembly protein FliH